MLEEYIRDNWEGYEADSDADEESHPLITENSL